MAERDIGWLARCVMRHAETWEMFNSDWCTVTGWSQGKLENVISCSKARTVLGARRVVLRQVRAEEKVVR